MPRGPCQHILLLNNRELSTNGYWKITPFMRSYILNVFSFFYSFSSKIDISVDLFYILLKRYAVIFDAIILNVRWHKPVLWWISSVKRSAKRLENVYECRHVEVSGRLEWSLWFVYLAGSHYRRWDNSKRY